MRQTTARIVSVNSGRVAPLAAGARNVSSAIVKLPRAGRVAVGPLGLEGDEQADPRYHGGPAKAVYAYPGEHYGFWNTLRRQSLRPEGRVVQEGLIPWPELDDLPFGALGENLTVAGLEERTLWIGDRLAIGDARFIVSAPREPCFKFNARMGFGHAAKMMVDSGYCGFYLQVARDGSVGAHDPIEVTAGDRHVTVAQAFALRMQRRA